jgi:hypothetical protein
MLVGLQEVIHGDGLDPITMNSGTQTPVTPRGVLSGL